MSEFNAKAVQLSPELYERFKTALELGKWPDGQLLTEQQKNITMEAVIIYEHNNVPEQQHLGAFNDKCLSESKENSDDEQTLTLQ